MPCIFTRKIKENVGRRFIHEMFLFSFKNNKKMECCSLMKRLVLFSLKRFRLSLPKYECVLGDRIHLVDIPICFNSFGAKFQTTLFSYFNKLSFGKTFVCKVERLNVKQRRSR